jgi:hypothetical protein
VGRLVFIPRYDGARGDCYPFSGAGRLDPVLGGLIARPTGHNAMVTPAGFEPAFTVRHALS